MIKDKTSDTLERINYKTIKYIRKILKNNVEPLCPYTVVTTIKHNCGGRDLYYFFKCDIPDLESWICSNSGEMFPLITYFSCDNKIHYMR